MTATTSTLTAPALPDVPRSAFDAARRRWRGRVQRSVLVTGLLCVAIAAVLAAIEGRGFLPRLVYSCCIGAVCMVVVDGVRLLAAGLSDRVRRANGQPYQHDDEVSGWQGVVPGGLLAVLVGPALGLWLGDRITGFETPSLLDFGASGTRLTILFSVLATVSAIAVLSTLERLASTRAQAEAAQRAAAENQLRLLQSQLEPHMLFNTLANLRVLIGLDPARAQGMLDHLIAFLRSTLQASRSAAHPLSAEFAHLQDYLALMAVRMGPRLAVRLDLPDTLRAVPVPPLLLQPLVENAIKHGLEPQVAGGRIEVSARREGTTLRLVVRDTGAGLAATPAAAGTSFGLEQVRSRLRALHGDGAQLTLRPASDAEGGAVAEVTLPLGAA